MPKVDPKGLEELLKNAGVSARMAKKIRDANGVEAPRPRNQGSSEVPEFMAV